MLEPMWAVSFRSVAETNEHGKPETIVGLAPIKMACSSRAAYKVRRLTIDRSIAITAGSIFMVAGEVIQHRSDMRPGEIVWMFPVLTVTQDNLELGQNAFYGRGRCLR
ncbi:hypothetical protein [Mesorhizobium abyssinicae]|uniref:hypothetical protein n=1 Tax=Mesorhizobium abyssinicae TaxID=1209958 RepID=UPI0033909982